MSKIFSLTELSSEVILEQVKEIFFLRSDVKFFDSPEEKESFYNRWLNVYVKYYHETFYIAYDEAHHSEKVLGYLCLCEDTFDFIEKFGSLGGQSFFLEEIQNYPAHLHINVLISGKGVGRLLMNYASEYLKSRNAKGIHIITSPDSQNVSFYQRHQFAFNKSHRLNNKGELFFMGRSL